MYVTACTVSDVMVRCCVPIQQALQLSKALNQAIERLLENRKSPGRKVNQLDNRASNFYIALYWAGNPDPNINNPSLSLCL